MPHKGNLLTFTRVEISLSEPYKVDDGDGKMWLVPKSTLKVKQISDESDLRL